MTPNNPSCTTPMSSDNFNIDALMAKIAQLEARVQQLDESNRKLDESNRKLEDSNRKLEDSNRKLEDSNKLIEAVNCTLKEELRVCTDAAKDLIPATRAIFRVGESLMTGDPEEDAYLLSVIEAVTREVHRIAMEAQRLDHYRRVGKDANTGSKSADNSVIADEKQTDSDEPSSPSEVIDQEVNQPLEEKAEEAKQKLSDSDKLMSAANEGAKKAKCVLAGLGVASRALEAIVGIINTPAPPRAPFSGKASPGRQKAKVQGQKRTSKADPLNALICPQCGKPVESLGEFSRHSKSLAESIIQRLILLESQTSIGYCYNCKCAVSSITTNTSVTLTPDNGSTVAQDLVIEGMEMQTEGVPRNAVEKMLFTPMNLGHDTMCRQERSWMDLYGSLLLYGIQQQAQSEELLLSDETPFRCLELEGRGVSPLRKSTNEKEGAKQGYVLSICNREDSVKKFVIFNAMIGRSAKAIREHLEPYLKNDKLKLLVTDGYEAYDTILRQADWGVTRAACWTHWRRTIIKAVEFDLFAKQVRKLSVEEAENLFVTRLTKENSTTDLFLYLIEGIRKLYAHDRALKPLPNESQKDFLNRVRENRNKYAKVIVKNIDEIIDSIKDKVVVRCGNRFKAAPKVTPQQAAVVTYYLNNREELMAFLNDPRVPLDTNAIERCIRPVACLEGTTKYRQTVLHMQNMCNIFTLFETAKRNGITRPDEYLKKFGRAVFKYCFEKRWTQEFETKGVYPVTKGLRNWNMKELRDGFDVTPWLPWNYQEPPLPEAVK